MDDMDRSQLQKAVAGDAEALSSLLGAIGPAVERTLRIENAWRAHIDTADVMQVTYIEAFRNIREFDPEKADRFESWLRQIAENNLRDAIRGLTRQKRGGADTARNARASEYNRGDEAMFDYATSSTPSRAARRDERANALEKALSKLPPDYARVVQLMDVEGRPIAEAAVAMSRSHGAVHMLRARAYDRLREILGSASEFLTQV